MNHPLPRRTAFLLFALVVVTWGLNWAVTKTIVHSVVPLWATAIRSAIATATLFVLQLARGQIHHSAPRRPGSHHRDCAASHGCVLRAGGIRAAVRAGRPADRARLHNTALGRPRRLAVPEGADDQVTTRGNSARRRGLIAMFNPLAFDWSDRDALTGGGLILLATLCWAANILYVRAHRWVSTQFQLVFWQTLLASVVLAALALLLDGAPQVAWTSSLTAAFLYSRNLRNGAGLLGHGGRQPRPAGGDHLTWHSGDTRDRRGQLDASA
jgi:hypothetical protein